LKLVVFVIPDFNTATAELRAHQIDLILTLPAPNYKLLQSIPGIRVMAVKAPTYTSIEMNLRHPPLDDAHVRRAIDYAIDKQRIVSDLTAGTGTVATADLSTFYWAYDPAVTTYPHDLSKASALLDEAGWKRGADGMRSKNGRLLSLQLAMGVGSETARGISVKVQADLRAAGIDVPIKPYSYSVLYATQALGGILHGGKFDLAEFSWVSGADPDDSSQWMCSMAPPAGNNDVRYCNPAVDRAENTALTHFDRQRRKAAYASIQQHLAADVPMAFLYYSPLRYAMDPNLQNFQPNGISEGWNAYEWKI
jgi:peptide/nickel transport system substrate-binding protein